MSWFCNLNTFARIWLIYEPIVLLASLALGRITHAAAVERQEADLRQQTQEIRARIR